MSYEKSIQASEVPNTSPIEVTPLAEDFKADLYRLYKVYRPEQQEYYFDN
jgi:hypothetical protein